MSVLNSFLSNVVVQIINPIIMLLSTLAFLLFAWGMFEFVRNAGNATKKEEGRNAILWGLIGLVIIFGAYGIINVVTGTLGITQTVQSMTQGGR